MKRCIADIIGEGDEIRMAFIFLSLSYIMIGKTTDFGMNECHDILNELSFRR